MHTKSTAGLVHEDPVDRTVGVDTTGSQPTFSHSSGSPEDVDGCGTITSAASAAVNRGYNTLMTPKPSTPPRTSAAMNDDAEDGAMPANVFETCVRSRWRGWRNWSSVKKYAPPMYPDRRRGEMVLPFRARAKMTNNSPKVASTSDRKWALEARCLVEISKAALANSGWPSRHRSRSQRPGRRRRRGSRPRNAGEGGVDEGDDRVEVRTGDGAEDKMST